MISKIEIVGSSTDDKNCISGAFYICDTVGYPLEDLLRDVLDQGLLIAWDCYIQDAKNSGWTRKTTLKKIKSAVEENHKNGWVEVEERCLKLIDKIYI